MDQRVEQALLRVVFQNVRVDLRQLAEDQLTIDAQFVLGVV